jgi:hypothetical protein
MKDKARLIIPLWGVIYAEKLTSMTLPALLAPGNLPALCAMFDVEVVIVTEEELFRPISQSRSFAKLSEICPVNLVPLDDLMTGIPGDYGVVLTNALFRGFVDLGPKMTETFLLFLNADFIIADGSYRRLGDLMLQGHRVIHAPSFRVVLEDVWPQLDARVDRDNSVLAMKPRDMVRLAMTNRHMTVKARTVNQRTYHQWRMDQFYWYVDDDTMIGYQWPVALVAIKPERVVKEPVLVWDYGFIPEAAATLEKYFIEDSDEFFMLEPQKRASGEEMIRVGWISFDAIAKDLSVWTTKEQRECGEKLFKFHANDLPAGLDQIIAESRVYMSEIRRRLKPPQSHIKHGMLGDWFDGAMNRIKARQAGRDATNLAQDAVAGTEVSKLNGAKPESISRFLSSLLKKAYRLIYRGRPIEHSFHPFWIDTHYVISRVLQWRQTDKARILWLSSRDSLFGHLLGRRVDPQSLIMATGLAPPANQNAYDACLCELSPGELAFLPALYGKIRDQVKDEGQIVIFTFNPTPDQLGTGYFVPYDSVFPDVDPSNIRFFGTAATSTLRSIYMRAAGSSPCNPLLRSMLIGLSLIALAPFVWAANRRASRKNPELYSRFWTSAVLEFTVNKSRRSP